MGNDGTIEINGTDLVNEHWPLYGPYSPEHTRAAASAIGELVRYLNYVSQPQGAAGMRWPSDVDSVVGSLQGAVGGLEQTFRQLGERFAELADDPAAYVAEDPTRTPGEIGAEFAATMLDLVAAAGEMTRLLTAAHSHSARIGHRTLDPEGEE